MGTTAQAFYPRGVDWDGTDPAGGDIQQLSTSLGTVTNTSICDFGTSGAKTITVDPYTTRSTTGASSNFGWAINIAGSEGMDGTSAAKRWIPAGPWTFEGTLTAAPVASLASCTVDNRVYRVSADGSTRTLIFASSTPAGVISATGTAWSLTTASKAEVVFEEGETLQVTFTLACTGQLGGLTIAFQTGNGSLTDCRVLLPTPGLRTLGEGSGAASGAGTADAASSTVLATVGTSAGTGSASGVLGATAGMVGASTATGTAVGAGGSVAATTGQSDGAATVTGSMSAQAATTGTAAGAATVDGIFGATGGMVGSASGAATVTGEMSARADMVGSSSGAATTAGQGSSVAGTVGTAAGTGTADGLASIVLGTVGTVEIGAGTSTTIRPLLLLVDD